MPGKKLVPYFGRKVSVRLVEQRATGQFLKVQVPSGIVVSIPCWMVDPVACANLRIGPPQVNLAALSDLKRLVTPIAVSTNFPSENGIAWEEVDETAQRVYVGLGQTDEPDIRAQQGGRDERRGADEGRNGARSNPDAGRRPRGGGAQ